VLSGIKGMSWGLPWGLASGRGKDRCGVEEIVRGGATGEELMG